MKRHLLRHFVDVKMDTSAEGTAADYRLLGTGITSLTEEMNPETETVQYINQENGSTDLKSYTPSIEIERQNVDEEDQDLTDWFNKMIDTLPVGADAITSYVRVRVSGAGPE